MNKKHLLSVLMLIASASWGSADVIWVDAGAGDDAAAGSEQSPLRTITAAVAKADEPGDVVRVRDGIYRGERIRFAASGIGGKPITLEAAPGAKPIIRGSAVVSEWSRSDLATPDRPIYSTTWAKFFGEWSARLTSDPQGDLKRIDARNMSRNQVFVDGAYIEEVPRKIDLKPGSVWMDREAKRAHLWLADGADPASKRVEFTDTEGPLLSTWGHDWLVIRGLAFEHCANTAASRSMVRVQPPDKAHATDRSDNVVVESCSFRFSNGTGLALTGTDNLVLNCDASDNAQSGVLLFGSIRATVKGGTWFRNNKLPGRRHDHGWEASNKVATTRDTVIDGVEVAYNSGFGIWPDGDNRNVTIRNCNVHHNFSKGHNVSGIRYELGYSGRIYNNVIHHNDGGVSIDASSGCWVFNNTFYRNTGEAVYIGGTRKWNNKDPNLHGKIQRGYGNKFFNNIVADNARASQYKKHVIITLNISDPSFNPPKFPDTNGVVPFAQNWSDHNLVWADKSNPSFGGIYFPHKGSKNGQTLADWQQFSGLDLNSIWMQDPLLVDPDNGDFRIRPDSPAIGKGTIIPDMPPEALLDRDERRREPGKIDLGAYQAAGER
jgi:parallel beta-helix repeat protein